MGIIMRYRNTDIQNAVNAGKVVSVSKTDVTVGTWTGVGYIILDPNTGAGAYMISGGFAGGGSFVPLDNLVKYFPCIAAVLDLISIAIGLELLFQAVLWLIALMIVAASTPVGIIGVLLLTFLIVFIILVVATIVFYIQQFNKHWDECKALLN